MGLSYSDYVTQLATLAVVPEDDSYFQIILPDAISYAELRIQRDLDLLSTQVENDSYFIYAGNPYLSIPTSDFVTLQTLIAINLAGTVKSPLIPASKEFIQNVYPAQDIYYGFPKYFAVYGGDQNTGGQTYQNVLLGPVPDDTYNIVVTGTQRDQTLSINNPSTYISIYLPDLFLMASMIYVSAYQRNFGKLNDDPQMAVTYESQYQALLKGATVEEYRKKFEGPAWSSRSPSPIATPPRS